MNSFLPDPPAAEPKAESAAEPAAEAPKCQPRVWFEILAVVGLTLIPSIWFSFEAMLKPRTLETNLSSQIRWVCTCALETYAILYFVRIAGIPFVRIGIVRLKWNDLAIALAVLILDFGVNGILHRVIPHIDGIEVRPPIPDPFASANFALYFAWRITASFSEEVVARGYLITRIWDATGSPLAAVFLSAAAFGAAHAYQGTHAIVYTTVTGLIYGFGFAFCRRLWPFALVHAFWNLVVVGRQ